MRWTGCKKLIYTLIVVLTAVVAVSGLYFRNRLPNNKEYLSYAPSGHGHTHYNLKVMTGGSIDLPGMDLVAKDEFLELYLNQSTCEIAVHDTSSNHTWYSNPPDRNKDELANNAEKELMSSQLTVKYFDYYRRLNTFNSYTDSVSLGQFELYSIDHGIRVLYRIGDLSPGVNLLPQYITMERLEEKILSRLNDSDRKYFLGYYPESTDKPGFRQRNYLVERSVMVTRKMIRIAQEAGYTDEDLLKEVEISGEQPQSLTKPHVVIPLEYRLQDGKLIVDIPVNDIIENEVTLVSQIELLRFFGSGNMNDTGYIFVPNGCGGIINLNNGKVTSDEYVQSVYGNDFTTQSYITQQIVSNVKLPVYGQKVNDQAFLAVIENADAIAVLKANISGKNNSYNIVYPTFHVRKYDTAAVDLSNDLAVVEKNLYQGNVTLSYIFLSGEDATYTGMAAKYREKLVADGVLHELGEEENLPFFVDLLGSVSTKAHLFGIPFTHDKKLTSFREAGQIAADINSLGFHDPQIRFVGWFNDGLYHSFPTSIDIDRSVGNIEELRQLDSTVRSFGGALYPDVAFIEVSMASRNFNSSKYASRYVIGTKAVTGNTLPPTMQFGSIYGVRNDEWRYLLSPSVLLDVIGRFDAEYDRIGIGAISLRDMGDSLSSDKRTANPIDRSYAENIVIQGLARMNEKYQLMISDPNNYALGCTTKAIGVPVDMNHFMIMDESVPFYQMVIHGCIDYASIPINASDYPYDRTMLLRLIETGTIPRYAFTFDDNSSIKGTTANQYLSVCYKDWIGRAKEFYDIINDLLSDVRTLQMTSHEYLNNSVVRVTYADGTEIWVNYGKTDYTLDGFTVKSQGYGKKVDR